MTDHVITVFTKSSHWFVVWTTHTLNTFSLRNISLNLFFIADSTARQTVGVVDDMIHEMVRTWKDAVAA